MKKVAIIGTVGLPANYGGFETLVDNIIDKSSDLFDYTVFCSKKAYDRHPESYKGAKLVYLNFKANGMQSTIYDIVSMLRVGNKYDVVLILGVSGCIFLPIFRLYFKNKLLINVDGIEHRREKWGRLAKWFLKKSEAMAVKYADVVLTDNKGIQNYVLDVYNKFSACIPYGGDQVIRDVPESVQQDLLTANGINKSGFAISVCRIEPENNCHMILDACANTGKPLVFIGNWSRSEYGRKLFERYSSLPNIMMKNPIYDLDTLFALRSNASVYIHGHSAGGTNPSLVEAMFFGIPIFAFDVNYNRFTTGGEAYFFNDVHSLTDLLTADIINAKQPKEYAQRHYLWTDIVYQYARLFDSAD